MLIREVWESDPDYMQWLSDIDIKSDTLKVIRTVVSDFGK
jgi:hypothetical protein